MGLGNGSWREISEDDKSESTVCELLFYADSEIKSEGDDSC